MRPDPSNLDESASGEAVERPSTAEVIERLENLWARERPAVATALSSLVGERIGMAELADRLQAGEEVDLQALCSDCPEHFEQLEMLLPTLQAAVELTQGRAGEAAGGGHCLGDFRILRELGRGGMGVVYEAEQISLGRHVALKILPFAAILDKQHLARFKNEARAAATLEHPNIVAIFSVGAVRGIHYYAMQLVEGQSLAEVVAQLKARHMEQGAGSQKGGEQGAGSGEPEFLLPAPCSPLPARRSPLSADTQPVAALSTLPAFDTREYFRTVAKLGIQAAEALDHAHQNGVLHRDVKPGNLLVDDSGKLWVTDFGLARIEADAGMTMTGDLLGTLRYMSPEQALANRGVVDHRTDVYSLGVTLYELLTLRPAYSGDDRQELLRQIAFQEPRSPRRINSRIPQDLETIVLKAMEKGAADRYTTAQELADDMRRFLASEPIKARPPTPLQRITKWSRRHVAVVWTVSLALLVATIGLGFSTWLIGNARDDALAARTEAEANFQKALAAVDAMLTEVGEESLANIPQMEPVRRALLEKALGFYQDFLQERGDEPQVRLETARAYRRVSDTCYLLGRHLEAQQACHQAISILEELEQEFSDAPSYQEETATSYHRLGLLFWTMRYQVAEWDSKSEAAYREALFLYEKLAAAYPDEPRYRHALANAYSDLADLLSRLGRDGEAESSYRTAIRFEEELKASVPASFDYLESLGSHYSQLARLLHRVERNSDAEHNFRQALELHRRLAEHAPDLPGYRRALALSLHRLGKFLADRPEEAEAAYREAAALQERLVEDFPNVWDYRWELTYTLDDLGQLLHHLERTEAAQSQFARAAEIYLPTVAHRERLAREFPTEIGHHVWLVASYSRLAGLFGRAGRDQDAIDTFLRAIGSREELMAQFPKEIRHRLHAATIHVDLGDLFRATGRLPEAAKAYRTAAELLDRIASEAATSVKDPGMLNSIAWYITKLPDAELRDSARAVELARIAVELAPSEAYIWNTLGVAHYQAGEYQSAVDALQRSMELSHEGDSMNWFFLGMAHWRLGQADEAAHWYDKGVKWMESHDRHNEALIRFRNEAEELLGRAPLPAAAATFE